MLVDVSLAGGPLLFPKLGDAQLAPVDQVPAADSSGTGSKVGDLAMLLSIVSSLVLIFRR